MTVKHATFTIERTYPASPEKVWNAWSDPEKKAKWFAGPHETSDHELDFRIGGREHVSGKAEDTLHRYEAVYQDIVPNERIVTTYQMYQDETRTSVSVATVEIEPDGEGTRLTYTEQGAFFDDLDRVEWREQGTNTLFDQLGRQF
ncbi:polyketide cyclase [Lentzea tibetensis]|uniref:Polyketide cyclase n=1 Tax=Lentzea tibetensis TaxID=2591470 RepID=A0A563EWV6_9PSEU|nr:SRPBCC family protein [Lentzea tibetensis]TWP52180.1 polyketide cyclase [Lentzea tibetensis]